uniref:F-box domain-containing protein n=1 Tax=Bursaphelenchus xylophilus TaxID=6326 RepID=A0A1I7RZ68_BURXY
MISVTAAAHSFHRPSRSLGTHLKAYGSGRIALNASNSESNHPQIHQPGLLKKVIFKLWHLLVNLFKNFCPFVKFLVDVEESEELIKKKRRRKAKGNSIFDKLEDDVILKIFKFVDGESVLNLERTCSKLNKLIREHCDDLPKIQKDQIKLYFDEGEVIVSPVDERKVPSRYTMVPIESLSNYLRHLSTLSLFIRGLIPAETIPVLRRLARYRLDFSQIYFLWCELDVDADEYLKGLFLSNSDTLSDIGLESCSPTQLISDSLIAGNLQKLVSLRIWHDSSGHVYPITDRTLFKLVELMKKSNSPLETFDLNSCRVTVIGVTSLIEAWYNEPLVRGNLCLSLRNCGFSQYDLMEQCRNHNIPIDITGLLEKDEGSLTVNVN